MPAEQTLILPAEDFYDLLGVPEDAPEPDIHAAYTYLVRHYHPDKNKSRISDAKTKQLNEAFKTLRHTRSRRNYNRTRPVMAETGQTNPRPSPSYKPQTKKAKKRKRPAGKTYSFTAGRAFREKAKKYLDTATFAWHRTTVILRQLPGLLSSVLKSIFIGLLFPFIFTGGSWAVAYAYKALAFVALHATGFLFGFDGGVIFKSLDSQPLLGMPWRFGMYLAKSVSPVVLDWVLSPHQRPVLVTICIIAGIAWFYWRKR
ncbi:MAG: J domain-containing protein [Fibrobacteria bacterium]|nr:J domain-containing protein [Fibrobacteria bacterium]